MMKGEIRKFLLIVGAMTISIVVFIINGVSRIEGGGSGFVDMASVLLFIAGTLYGCWIAWKEGKSQVYNVR
jgi:hypothetical protein